MVLPVCQNLANCLNQGALSVVDSQKRLLKDRYLITGQGFDIAYPIVNTILSGVLAGDVLISKKPEENEYVPIGDKKVNYFNIDLKIAGINFLLQFILGVVEIAFISLDRTTPSFLSQTAKNLEIQATRCQQMIACNMNYSNSMQGKESYISAADSFVPGFADSYNYFVLSAVNDSAGFKMALSLIAIVGLALVNLTNGKGYKNLLLWFL